MAVKASTSITLSFLVDVRSTTRYYLLQSSTLSKPNAPTTYPPTGSWDDTEPGYTSGSTNTLYFVDCTVFADGSFAYSLVSKSSSYEAAKEAYNRATDAQNSAIATQQSLERRIRIDTAGMHVGDNQTNDELLFQSSRIYFVLNGSPVGIIGPDFHQMNRMEIRTPSVGGITIQAVQN